MRYLNKKRGSEFKIPIFLSIRHWSYTHGHSILWTSTGLGGLKGGKRVGEHNGEGQIVMVMISVQ